MNFSFGSPNDPSIKTLNWGYHRDDGPKKLWRNEFEDNISIERELQSPINLKRKYTYYDATLKENPLVVKYDPECLERISNNGRFLVVHLHPGFSFISGGPLLPFQLYSPAQMHFRWGNPMDHFERGSEHLLDGFPFAGELQILHFNLKYHTFANAVKNTDGLCILAIWLELQEGAKNNKNFSDVVKLSMHLKKPKAPSVMWRGFTTLEDFLPENRSDYWTYQGSLTYPPLYESVTWIIFKETHILSLAQFTKFVSLKISPTEDFAKYSSKKMPMINNFRPCQPIGTRIIRCSFESGADIDRDNFITICRHHDVNMS